MKNDKNVKYNPPTQETIIDNKTDQSKYVYDMVNGWIENADNKVSISCGVFGIVYGVLSFLAERITGETVNRECLKTTSVYCFIASGIVFGVSVFFYVLAINPNLFYKGKQHNKKGQKHYPVFYGDIAGMELDQYIKTVNKADSSCFIDEIQRETHINSCICLRKMKRYRIGLWTSFGAIVLAVISLATRYFMFH